MKARKRRTQRRYWKLDGRLARDVIMLLPVTALLLATITGMTWQEAAWLSPAVVLGVFAGVFVLVQVMHLLFQITDRISGRFQFKRSPLA